MSNDPRPSTSDGEWAVIGIGFFVTFLVLYWWLSQQGPLANTILGAIGSVVLLPHFYLYEAWPGIEAIPFLGPFIVKGHDIVGFLSEGGYILMNAGQRGYLSSALGPTVALYMAPFIIMQVRAAGHLRPDQLYRGKDGFEALIFRQSKHWRTTRYARTVNPLKEKTFNMEQAADYIGGQSNVFKNERVSNLLYRAPLSYTPPRWSRALRPEEWVVSQGANFDFSKWSILKQRAIKGQTDFEFRDRWSDLTTDDLAEVFASSFLEPWRGFKSLSPSLQAICAVAVLYYEFRRPEGETLLNALGVLASQVDLAPGAMDRAIANDPEITALLHKTFSSESAKILEKMANEHAWKVTALLRVIEEGKKNRGVLASASFVWLRTQDRKIWYALNALGGDAVMVEAAAAMAHYKAEMQIGAPIIRPTVFQVCRGFIEEYADMRPERVARKRIKIESRIRPADRLRRTYTEKEIMEER